ncbi:MAG TPA: prolipoprotein diacylglyceryl transferase [Zoogloea sp.]|uniref:prolipoprotein diacylglyceryl transferase n=1 Tax=Zoogloea sp. TaxID=49181 RepID=UPI002B691DA0|nr:prolipoprotein diacylglyceryl transferase [Zoogloea sp.]HMV64381.1 prolipoprotein diacylglyceryl transferase [Rhodocyclaceae bacterium]HMW51565.1 prolipoprotein diacylglyceryl transferase [Rhodocyclaceae bacterium]HNE17539.1 prolipoprotein diacylglyceryl transferase [Rhodocyclaceae bacterium]HNI48812.1 prolipoprotein diacylglyceryl transferase [Zoogloea sp.]
MLVHPQFNPVALSIGPLDVRWYGLMYLTAFILFVALGRAHARRRPELGWDAQQIDDLLFYGVLGVILGGRLGYILFYKPAYYFSHPVEMFAVWQGGMAFHGGFLGVLIAVWLFARSHDRPWLAVTDFIAPLVPLGLAAGRLGNFINGELVGRVTDVPWAMIFPQVDMQPRHPSQLYQFTLEGVCLFVLLWVFSAKPRPRGLVSAVFLIGYGGFRILAEFGREPDDFLGLLALNLSMGQWLSLPMIVIGIVMAAIAVRRAADT